MRVGTKMTHLTEDIVLVLSSVILLVVSGILFISFSYKRKKTRINALDYLMMIFGTVFLSGILQILSIYTHDQFKIFGIYEGGTSPLLYNVVRIASLMLMLVLYFMSEHILRDTLNIYKLSILTTLLTLLIFIDLYFASTGILIHTDDFFLFAQHTRMDELIFDIIQLFAVGSLMYAIYLQYSYADAKRFKRILRLILIAISLYLLSLIYELLEHVLTIPDIDSTITAIPTLLLIAYVYLRFPNFIYFTPSNIMFLQIVTEDGAVIYTVELKQEYEKRSLAGTSLAAVNMLLNEIIKPAIDKPQAQEFKFVGATIIIEKVNNLLAIILVDRPTRILKRSMRYFIREFNKTYRHHFTNFTGRLTISSGEIKPDDILIQCIPIIETKAFISSIRSD